jgi:hypothetical protein
MHRAHPIQPMNVRVSLRKIEERMAQMTTESAPRGCKVSREERVRELDPPFHARTVGLFGRLTVTRMASLQRSQTVQGTAHMESTPKKTNSREGV